MCTLWGPPEWRPRPATGRGSRGRSAVSRSTVPEAKRTRGMYWLLTTSTSRPEVPSIALHSLPSLSFVSSPGPTVLAENSRW